MRHAFFTAAHPQPTGRAGEEGDAVETGLLRDNCRRPLSTAALVLVEDVWYSSDSHSRCTRCRLNGNAMVGGTMTRVRLEGGDERVVLQS